MLAVQPSGHVQKSRKILSSGGPKNGTGSIRGRTLILDGGKTQWQVRRPAWLVPPLQYSSSSQGTRISFASRVHRSTFTPVIPVRSKRGAVHRRALLFIAARQKVSTYLKWTPHVSHHSKEKGAAKFALTWTRHNAIGKCFSPIRGPF